MTAPRRTPRGVECKDCKAERERRGLPYPANPRPVRPGTGGRCHTHGLQAKRLSKSGAHERRVQKEYGLGPGEYGQLYLHQGGKCAICRWARGISKNLSVDHDHKTGLVRGLLCTRCNQLLGHLKDDPEAGRRIAQYLVRPPAKELGIVAIHKDNREEEGSG